MIGGTVTAAIGALAVRLTYRENSRLDAFATGILGTSDKAPGWRFAKTG